MTTQELIASLSTLATRLKVLAVSEDWRGCCTLVDELRQIRNRIESEGVSSDRPCDRQPAFPKSAQG